MPGNFLLTVSPRVPVADSERVLREQLARFGAARMAATTGDRWQVRQLRRLAARFRDGDGPLVTLGEHTDGTTVLGVHTAALVGVWGEPKTG